MEQFVQLTVNGLTDGAILTLAALGFVLIYKASGVINFAQGFFLAVGAYVLWTAIVEFGLPWPVGLLVALGVAALLGVSVERLLLRPLVGQPVIAVVMITVALAQILDASTRLIWGTEPRSFPEFIPSGSVELLGARVAEGRLWAIGLSAIALLAFGLFFTRSRQGIAMRAVADDQQAALAVGISVPRIYALAWALAGMSAVIGGMLVANLTGVSQSVAGFGLLVFPVVILGGLDSVAGAAIGGPVLGLLTSYTGGYVGGGLQTVIPFIVLVAVLMMRPYGLFGQVRIERV